VTDQPEWIHGTSSRVIVSAGLGSAHYRKMLRSTENHCAVHCSETWRLFFDVLPAGSPTHSQMQYAFKIEAMRRAVDACFDSILWMDATCQPTASIEEIWELIRENEYYIVKQEDARLGEWCNDEALSIFELTRDDAMEIPLVYTGLIGLKPGGAIGSRIWNEWDRLYKRGAFKGAHENIPVYPWQEHGAKWRGHCSKDPRCQGHRHDESAMSFVLWKLGLKPMENPKGLTAHGIERHVPDYDVVRMREFIEGHGLLGWEEAADACGDIPKENY
jgi:hypothetical protein